MMKNIDNLMLYTNPNFYNCLRVDVFLKEKSVEVARVELERDALTNPEILSFNPLATLPFAVFDDGWVLSESMAICRYIDQLFPTPACYGKTPRERAGIEMWLRRVELDLGMPVAMFVRNAMPLFENRVFPGSKRHYTQNPSWAELCLVRLNDLLPIFAERVENRQFIAQDQFSVADITLWLVLRNCIKFGPLVEAIEPYPSLWVWYKKMGDRACFEGLS